MSLVDSRTLLDHDEPAPVMVHNPDGASPLLITCEHAGNALPRKLGSLGLDQERMGMHIAWDIGAAETARFLSDALGAPLVMQRYSRLLIDCNRPPSSRDSIPLVSDGVTIPSNADLSSDERAARVREIFQPYHDVISTLLDANIPSGRTRALLSLHSFTPQLMASSAPRPWAIGVLYNRDQRLAASVHDAIVRSQSPYTVEYNEPYNICDSSDYTIPVHGEGRSLPHVLLEIRNDHISDTQGARIMARFLAYIFQHLDIEL